MDRRVTGRPRGPLQTAMKEGDTMSRKRKQKSGDLFPAIQYDPRRERQVMGPYLTRKGQ